MGAPRLPETLLDLASDGSKQRRGSEIPLGRESCLLMILGKPWGFQPL